jgi:hypothetical protein
VQPTQSQLRTLAGRLQLPCPGTESPQPKNSEGGTEPPPSRLQALGTNYLQSFQLPPPPCLPMPPSLLPVGLGHDPSDSDPAPVRAPLLQVRLVPESRRANQEVLASFDWDLGLALADQGRSPLTQGRSFGMYPFSDRSWGDIPYGAMLRRGFLKASRSPSDPSTRRSHSRHFCHARAR